MNFQLRLITSFITVYKKIFVILYKQTSEFKWYHIWLTFLELAVCRLWTERQHSLQETGTFKKQIICLQLDSYTWQGHLVSWNFLEKVHNIPDYHLGDRDQRFLLYKVDCECEQKLNTLPKVDWLYPSETDSADDKSSHDSWLWVVTEYFLCQSSGSFINVGSFAV